MDEAKRHQRELQATLEQIRARQAGAASAPGASGRKRHARGPLHRGLEAVLSRLNASFIRLALEGVGMFVLGILVGLGLYVLYEVLASGG